MKLLCREDHNGGASRSDVGDPRSNSDWAVNNGAAANPTAGLRAAGDLHPSFRRVAFSSPAVQSSTVYVRQHTDDGLLTKVAYNLDTPCWTCRSHCPSLLPKKSTTASRIPFGLSFKSIAD